MIARPAAAFRRTSLIPAAAGNDDPRARRALADTPLVFIDSEDSNSDDI
jgi:hypothetical protein